MQVCLEQNKRNSNQPKTVPTLQQLAIYTIIDNIDSIFFSYDSLYLKKHDLIAFS
jgi:hypothetical protein